MSKKCNKTQLLLSKNIVHNSERTIIELELTHENTSIENNLYFTLHDTLILHDLNARSSQKHVSHNLS